MKNEKEWRVIRSDDPEWHRREVQLLTELGTDDPECRTEWMLCVLTGMEAGLSLTQALAGVAPLTPSYAMGEDWVVAQRADNMTLVTFLTLTPSGLRFQPRQGLHFPGCAVMDVRMADGTLRNLLDNHPDAPHTYLYNIFTGLEAHYL